MLARRVLCALRSRRVEGLEGLVGVADLVTGDVDVLPNGLAVLLHFLKAAELVLDEALDVAQGDVMSPSLQAVRKRVTSPMPSTSAAQIRACGWILIVRGERLEHAFSVDGRLSSRGRLGDLDSPAGGERFMILYTTVTSHGQGALEDAWTSTRTRALRPCQAAAAWFARRRECCHR